MPTGVGYVNQGVKNLEFERFISIFFIQLIKKNKYMGRIF